MHEKASYAGVATPRTTAGIRGWVRDHDEKWSFVFLYLGLAVGLSVFVSLFWLLAVAGIHLLLECMRQSHYRDGGRAVFTGAIWEIKLDIGLVLLALMLVLYIDAVLGGLLGVQSAARAGAVSRAGARLGARAAAWERNIRTLLLTVDEMARIVYAAVVVRKGAKADPGGEGEPAAASVPRPRSQKAGRPPLSDASEWRRWREWGLGDRIGVALVASSLLLILIAPLVTHHDWGGALAAIMAELRPFPGGVGAG